MACYNPLRAWYSRELNASGKRSLVFDSKYSLEPDSPLEIACGQCVGCRLERSRQWAIRCLHEASLYENNCFITLTFNDDALENRSNMFSLDVRDFQLFMKRLRKRFGANIRFFHCGEYGENGGRPHYHACLFNFDFEDKVLWKEVNGNRLYISQSLSELWSYGFTTIGDVTFESAAYVARYIMKKITGDKAEEHYQWADFETGEIQGLKPEYVTMSRRPGIGMNWYKKFKSDLYPKDFITVNGVKCTIPKYYDRVLEKENPDYLEGIKDKRLDRLNLMKISGELSWQRLKTKEKISYLRLQKLKRSHDEI